MNERGRKLNWRQACQVLGCSRSYFYKLIDAGELPALRFGKVRGLRVYEKDCLDYLARRGGDNNG